MIPEKSESLDDLLFSSADGIGALKSAYLGDLSSSANNSVSNMPGLYSSRSVKIPSTYSNPQQMTLDVGCFTAVTAEDVDEMLAEEETLDFSWVPIPASEHAQQTINPIRRIVDVMNVQPNPDKSLIRLHIGDPTVSGVLPVHPNVCQSVVNTLTSGKYNGYGPACGFPEVRQAVADFVTPKVTAEDVVLTSGCSHALQLAIEALANPGQNVLVPRPGFPLYTTLMRPLGVQERHYDLLAGRNWEVDLEHMASLIDTNTAAIVVNNPNNPCGAVYSKEHLQQILRLAELYRVPIIADEIYGDMVYDGAVFHPMASLEPKIPMLTCDGISKRYLVPGWRLGWIIVNDVDGAMENVRCAIRQLAQKIVGPCALMQGALPSILRNTPPEFFERTRSILSCNATIVCRRLARVPGLRPIRSHGAMYIMVSVDLSSFPAFQGHDELNFTQALLSEQSVYCLPGSAFNYPGAFRIVLTTRRDQILESCDRISEFCIKYYKKGPPSAQRVDSSDSGFGS